MMRGTEAKLGYMAKGVREYTYSSLHKAFTGELSEYAYNEAQRKGMDINDFMARYGRSDAQRDIQP